MGRPIHTFTSPVPLPDSRLLILGKKYLIFPSESQYLKHQ
jgi:hypothetical protein